MLIKLFPLSSLHVRSYSHFRVQILNNTETQAIQTLLGILFERVQTRN